MKITLKVSTLPKTETDLLVISLFEDNLLSPLTVFDTSFVNLVSEAMKKEGFTGKDGEKLILSSLGKISAYKILFQGLGKSKDFNLDKLRKFSANAVKKAINQKSTRLSVVLSEDLYNNLSSEDVAFTTSEAIYLSFYRFLKYKSREEQEKSILPEEVELIVSPGKLSSSEKALATAFVTSDATIYARNLINEPSDVTTPAHLAEKALDLVKLSKGTIKVKITDKAEAHKMGMGGFLGVARGSDEPPKFIRLSYKPAKSKAKIVLVGKGITFDTGGLSLKSAEHMETMKLDMAGAAAVMGIFKAIYEMKPEVEVIGMIAATENMPSGKALKPGDILKTVSGKTIEVLNTDAEGRLTLADCLSLAVLEKPDAIIDLATLTGACMVALGQNIAGAFSNDVKLMERVKKASRQTGEKIWELPLEKDYKELIKSHIADLRNISSGRYGGAITAALFLSEFVGTTPWVHLDIAGPAYEEKNTPLVAQGGAGFGVRTVMKFLMDY